MHSSVPRQEHITNAHFDFAADARMFGQMQQSASCEIHTQTRLQGSTNTIRLTAGALIDV